MALPGVNPTYRYLDSGDPDGSILGNSTSAKVGFWNATPSSQRAATNQADPGSAAAVSVSATQYGFGTSTQANSLINFVWQLRQDLVTLGIIKGGA
jgi:hypothetical protein